MATVAGAIGAGGGSASWVRSKDKKEKMRMGNGGRAFCVSASSVNVSDPYRTLRIQPGASESEVKKAFRQLALQYHPDVCRENNCRVQFHHINEAYDIVMSNLRGDTRASEIYESFDQGIDEPMRGMDDPDWELWEEWMGWEGAGIRDYSSHINPYI